MLKRTVVILVLAVLVLVLPAIHAAQNVSLTEINDSYARVNISDAVNLYSYEVNMRYNGTINAIFQGNFLGASGPSYGYSERSKILSVYGSILEAENPG